MMRQPRNTRWRARVIRSSERIFQFPFLLSGLGCIGNASAGRILIGGADFLLRLNRSALFLDDFTGFAGFLPLAIGEREHGDNRRCDPEINSVFL
jgi:hypothetical protein